MNGSVAASRARWMLATVFTLFMVLNVVIIFMVMVGHMPWHLPPETPVGLRVLTVFAACVLSYLLAQMMYKLLIMEDVPPSQAASPSMSLFACLVLLIAAFGFLGLGSWLWLPILFLLIVIWTIISLWTLLGWLFMIVILLFAAIGGALTYLMLK